MFLYSFDKLRKKLEELQIPLIGSSDFQIDFFEAYKKGIISFDEDLISLVIGSRKYIGYMFIQDYRISKYNALPKFHITKCSTIQDFMDKGLYKERYIWSNSRVNDVRDIETGQLYKDKKLELCKNCKSQIQLLISKTKNKELDKILALKTTEDFHEYIKNHKKMV